MDVCGLVGNPRVVRPDQHRAPTQRPAAVTGENHFVINRWASGSHSRVVPQSTFGLGGRDGWDRTSDRYSRPKPLPDIDVIGRRWVALQA